MQYTVYNCDHDYLYLSNNNTIIIIYGIGKSNEALSQDGKIAIASSVTVFIVASISFFIVGFLCGHFCQKKRKQSSAAGECSLSRRTDADSLL